MRRLIQINLLLWGLLLTHQTLWAQQEVVFKETFDGCSKAGGRDGTYNTAGTNPAECVFDNEGWDNSVGKFYPASKCVKFGTAKDNGVLSTPHISLKEGTTATLTFNAAGWTSGDNTLEISATGCTVAGDISLKGENKLKNGEWTPYTVNISDITGTVQITFKGKRGFLDDVVVTGEKGGDIVVTVPEPTLTNEFTFWANTTEMTKRIVTITPAKDTSVRYTTDGSEPTSKSTQYTNPINITKTKVIRAKLFCDGWLSPMSSAQSYIFHPREITLPIFSVQTNDKYLNDKEIGLFANNNSKEDKKTHDWRRPVMIEFFPVGSDNSAFNQLGETRIQGGQSRSNALKSMVFYANKRFDPDQTLFL